MISVTIEYFIKPGQEAQYESLADRIHPEVYAVDGFISVAVSYTHLTLPTICSV